MNTFESESRDDVDEIDSPDGSCRWVRENAAAYATGSLETGEFDAISDHRLLCRECDGALERLQSVVALSGLAVSYYEPSPEVKARLFAAVAANQEAASVGQASIRVPAMPASYRSGGVWRRTSRIATTALFAGLLALAGWGIYAQSEMSDQADAIAELEQSNANLTTSATQQASMLPELSSYQLTNVSPVGNQASGIAMSADNNMTVFRIWNMPPEHGSYHVICESERGELLAAAEIVIDDSGAGTATVNLPSPLSEFRAVHVIPTDSKSVAISDLLDQDILKGMMDDSSVEE